jgi:hypothetical protein
MPFTDVIFPQVTTTWAYQTRNRFAFVGKYKSSMEMPTGQFIIKVTPEDEYTDEVPLVIGMLLVPIAHARDAEFPLPVCPRFVERTALLSDKQSKLGHESHTQGNWRRIGLKKDYENMFWSYRFVYDRKMERVTRELPMEFIQNDNEREWGVYVGIIVREPLTQYAIDYQYGQVIMGHILNTSATITVARRVHTRDGNIPNSTDRRRHRELRPKEERDKEKQDRERKEHEASYEKYRIRHQGNALDMDDV